MNNLEEESVSDFVMYTHKEVSTTKHYGKQNQVQSKNQGSQKQDPPKDLDAVSANLFKFSFDT